MSKIAWFLHGIRTDITFQNDGNEFFRRYLHPYSLSIIRTRSEIKNDFKRSVSRSSGKTMEGQLPSAFSVRSPAWKTLCLLEEVGFLLAGGKGYSYHLNPNACVFDLWKRNNDRNRVGSKWLNVSITTIL